MFPENSNKIWISEGDPTGISPEILIKSIPKIKNILRKKTVVFVQSQTSIKINSIPLITNHKEIQGLKKGIYTFLNENLINNKLKPGKPSIHSGKISFLSLSKTIELQKTFGGNIITLPLSKEWVIKSGIKTFKGHTEELAKSYKCKTFMLMYSSNLKVLPLTTHVPLKKVSTEFKKIDFETLFSVINSSGIFKNPKIAFCGINPHAGEDGKIGDEENILIKPIIKKYKSKGWDIEGPLPADSVFIKSILGKYDIVFSCYHDQGLIPFKSIADKNGINLTLGLPFIRVSPDHGTAFNIAGKGIADPESLIKCFELLENY